MPNEKKVISISTTRKKVMGQIDVDGTMHDVNQLDFDSNQKLQATDGTAAYLSALYEAIRVLAPTIPEATVRAMGIEDGGKIILFAGGGVAAVESVFPNAASPEIPTSPG